MKTAIARPTWLKSNSMIFTVLGAVLILVLVSLFPMSTSIAQGINEGIVNGFEGVYDPVDHLYNLRFLYQDGSYVDISMNTLPLKDFSNHSNQTLWATPLDSLAAMKAGYAKNPDQVRAQLGTRDNVASFGHPFPGKPIAYTAEFLKGLSSIQLNPKEFGGPNIPPGSVPYNKLSGGILQIDTKSDGNTITQVKPGMVPPVLQSLVPSLK